MLQVTRTARWLSSHTGQPGLLAGTQQVWPCAQRAAHPKEQITRAALMAQGLLLDAQAGQIQLCAG